MAPETADKTADAPNAENPGSADGQGPRRRFRPSQLTILVTIAALGLNIGALAIVITSVSSTRDQVVRHLTENRAEAVVEEPASLPTHGGSVDDLLAIADDLEQLGQLESARHIRASAQRLLVAQTEEDGAFDFAIRLLESGHPREARRALYRILARADQPGTRWGELATQARFLIGKSLSMEADGREIEQGGIR